MAMQGRVRGTAEAAHDLRHQILVLSAKREGLSGCESPTPKHNQELAFSHVATLEEALSLISTRDFELVVIDGDEPTWNPHGLIEELKAKKKGLVCAIMVERGDEESWVRALSAGALDLIEKRQAAYDIASLLGRLSHRRAA